MTFYWYIFFYSEVFLQYSILLFHQSSSPIVFLHTLFFSPNSPSLYPSTYSPPTVHLLSSFLSPLLLLVFLLLFSSFLLSSSPPRPRALSFHPSLPLSTCLPTVLYFNLSYSSSLLISTIRPTPLSFSLQGFLQHSILLFHRSFSLQVFLLVFLSLAIPYVLQPCIPSLSFFALPLIL